MADEKDFPETWDELKERFTVLEGCPPMGEVNRYTPVQSAILSTTVGVVNEAMSRLSKLGVFIDDEQKRTRKTMGHEQDISKAMADIVVAGDALCSELTSDKDAYAEWSSGRRMETLFVAYLTIVRFLERELGKSDTSGKRTGIVE